MKLTQLLAALIALVIQAGLARAEVKTQWLDYKHGDQQMRGYLAWDDAIQGKRPAVLLLHRRDGMTELTLKNTEMFARLGYVVFAADIFGYGHGILPKDVPAMIVQSALYNKDRPLMRARAEAALDVLTKHALTDTTKIGVVGYCFGGTVGIELAETGAPLLGTVTIHGSFRDFNPDAAKNIKGRILILHGAEDTIAPLSEVELLIKHMRAAKTKWQMELYSGAEHGFSTPKDAAEEFANTQSVAASTRFFKDVLGR